MLAEADRNEVLVLLDALIASLTWKDRIGIAMYCGALRKAWEPAMDGSDVTAWAPPELIPPTA